MSLVPPVTRRRLVGAVLGVLAVAGLVACGDDAPSDTSAPRDDPRALTSDEAELLAGVRLRMRADNPVAVEMTWPGSPSSTFEAVLDLADHVAYGTFVSDAESGAAARSGVTAWDFSSVATAPTGDGDAEDVATPPSGAWTMRALSSQVPHDLFLALALNLGADRPENAQLLRQSSARFLRHDEVDGRAVSVFEGPQPAGADNAAGATAAPSAAPSAGTGDSGDSAGRTRYWVADDDGRLVRFEADLGLVDGELARIDVLDSWTPPTGLEQVAREVLASRG